MNIKKWIREWLGIKDIEYPKDWYEDNPPVVQSYDSGPLWKELVHLRNLVNALPFASPDTETVKELTERFNGLFENLARRVGDLEQAGFKIANKIYAHEQEFKLLGIDKGKL